MYTPYDLFGNLSSINDARYKLADILLNGTDYIKYKSTNFDYMARRDYIHCGPRTIIYVRVNDIYIIIGMESTTSNDYSYYRTYKTNQCPEELFNLSINNTESPTSIYNILYKHFDRTAEKYKIKDINELLVVPRIKNARSN